MTERPVEAPPELSTARENHVTVLVDFATGQVRSISAGQEREMAEATRRDQQDSRAGSRGHRSPRLPRIPA
jgi:hypothetical protein